jgi:glycosyltransferase involved in cell wall biosynthesis
MGAEPVVSISMVTYNHEKYVADAIRSVLNQSFRDLELVVVNDGSTDGTAAQIATFADPRLVVIHQDNRGPSAATNRALAACRGRYVALFSGDDVCHPDRIRRQLDEYARGGPRVLFAGCDFIDDDGRPLAGGHFAETIFHPGKRTRAQIIERLFHHGNYFNGITAFTERAILLGVPYDPGLLQLQDYDVWVRLAKNFDLCVMPDSLLHYRIRGGGGNLSSPTPERLVRLQNETYLILRRFFDGLSADLFREAFAAELVNPDFADGLEFACEQAFVYCRCTAPLGRLIGLERIQALLNDPHGTDLLARRYNFTNHQFFDLLKSVNVAESFDGDCSTLFLDTGDGWTMDHRVSQRVLRAGRDYCLTFQIPAGHRLRALRWDPIELRTCRVRIEQLELQDAKGQVRVLDPALVRSNGEMQSDGTFAFSTADPMFWWPVTGELAGVAIKGQWQFDDTFKTTLNQSQRIHDLSQQLSAAQRDLDRLRSSPSWRLTKPLRLAGAVARRLKAG